MPSSNYNLIRQAVIDKAIIKCMYQGYVREICPHAIGTKDGREQLMAYQFAGQSSKGLSPGGEWRCMAVSGISDVSSHAGAWHTDNNHSKRQTCVDIIDVEVAY